MFLVVGPQWKAWGRLPPRASPRQGGSRRFWAFLLGLALLAGVFTYVWAEGEERRALRRLPAAERAAIYQRTMENLKTVCDPAPGRSLREFCRSQAAVVLDLPECDVACQEIARRHFSLPSR
jgi:hypothetical protein